MVKHTKFPAKGINVQNTALLGRVYEYKNGALVKVVNKDKQGKRLVAKTADKKTGREEGDYYQALRIIPGGTRKQTKARKAVPKAVAQKAFLDYYTYGHPYGTKARKKQPYTHRGRATAATYDRRRALKMRPAVNFTTKAGKVVTFPAKSRVIKDSRYLRNPHKYDYPGVDTGNWPIGPAGASAAFGKKKSGVRPPANRSTYAYMFRHRAGAPAKKKRVAKKPVARKRVAKKKAVATKKAAPRKKAVSKKRAAPKKKRKPSAYNLAIGRKMKQGMTMKEAQASYKLETGMYGEY